VAFDERISGKGQVDLERLIMDTCVEGRRDSRLLFGMRGWMLRHYDLVNVNRLIRMAKEAEETAVLGAICDSVLEHAPRSSLRYVRKYCQRMKRPEFLFEEIAASKTMRRLNEEENLPVWKAWGLISREMEDMEGAIAGKAFVLGYLLEHAEGNARQISLGIGQSYEPVYSELKLCEEVGLLEPLKAGRATVYHLRPEFLKKALKPLLAA
jgi:hypothetical protein